MDKYEFNIKVEKIKKSVNESDFETAMKIADTIDWKRVRNANLLSMISTVYEKNAEYQEAKDILLIAFERAPIGKRLLYKLTQLALKQGDVQEAETYYREFCELSGDDSRQDVLRYLILKAKGAPIEQLIHSLESYTSSDLDEKWLYELAELYHQAGMENECVKTCDKIMLMFGLGQYVDKAMELKLQYAPLTKYQMDLVENRDKYEAKLKQIEENGVNALNSSQEEYEDGEKALSQEDAERAAAARREQLAAMEANYEETTNVQTPVYTPSPPLAQSQAYVQEAPPAQSQVYMQKTPPAQPQAYAPEPPLAQPQAYAPELPLTQPQAYAPEPPLVQPRTYAPEPPLAQPQAYIPEPPLAQPQAYVQETRRPQSQPYHQESQFSQLQSQSNFYGEPKAIPVPSPIPASEQIYRQESAVSSERQESMVSGNHMSAASAEAVKEVSVEEKLAVSMKEAEVEANLAEEMSKISIGNYTEEPVQEKTRVLQNVKDLKNKEEMTEKTKVLDEIRHIQPTKPVVEKIPAQASIPQKAVIPQKTAAFYHIMMESRSPENGLEMAVEVLKKAHQILKNRHPVAKISGEKLNQKGVLSSASMLAGKDLIVENAGDLSDAMLEELNQLLEKDNSQMMVILVDNPRQLEGICRVIPSLAKKFFITSSAEEAQNYIQSAVQKLQKESTRNVSARSQENRTTERIVQKPVQISSARQKIDSSSENLSGRQAARVSPVRQRQAVQVHQQAESLTGVSQNRQQADFSAGAAMIRQRMDSAAGTAFVRQTAVSSSSVPKTPVRYSEDKKTKQVVLSVKNGKKQLEEKQIMDIDEFAQYCCRYASQIDCNISGKSMLALYERIEIMEEDGIALTPEAAEDLIEEAADRAEKPSLGKRITGLFSSKYDKEGLLILKEEHFI